MATRQAEGSLYKVLTLRTLQAGEIAVADHQKLELELRELFTNLQHADPSVSAQDGNFGGNTVPFTTPAAVDAEIAVAHNLGKIPTGWQPLLSGKKGYSLCGSLYTTKDWDSIYIYFAVRVASDTSRLTGVTVY